MKRLFAWLLRTLLVLIVLLGALFMYFVHTPAADMPQLSGSVRRDSMDVGGLQRTYALYVPEHLPKGAPLLLVMHGSGEDAGQMRRETGYAFERLADRHGFAVVYPNAYEGYWDVCNIVGAIGAHEPAIDDVGFLTRLVDRLGAQIGIDPARAFAMGSSRGGSMALRLALEAPVRFRAVAAVSASVPTSDNFKCTPAAHGTPSVLIMNGTDDPLMPFDGGQVSLYGLAYKNGTVRSSRESGQYFADLDAIRGAPLTSQTPFPDGVRLEQLLWRNEAGVEVELAAIHGAGHGMPQPYTRRPRLLGPSASAPDGAELIWEFFARQH